MDVFARILARLEAPLLQRHGGAVLDEELCRVREELHAVVVAFARLQEVCEAVASLEAGRAVAPRSVSLMATVDATAQLQHRLTERIEAVDRVVRARSMATAPVAQTVSPESTKAETVGPASLKRKRPLELPRHDDEHYAAPTVKSEPLEEVHTKACVPEKASLSYFDRDDEQASVAGSETESEHDDPLPTEQQQQEPMELAQWVEFTHETSKLAQRLVSYKSAPALDDVAQVVEATCQVIANVPSPRPGQAFRGLARGQFINLLSSTVRIFKRGQRNKANGPLAQRTLRALDNAMTANDALQGLIKYRDELQTILHAMEQYEITTSTELKTSQPDEWRQKLAAVTDQGIAIITAQRRFTVEEFEAFVTSLETVVAQAEIPPGSNLKSLANGHFKKLIALTVRIFQRAKRYATLVHVAQSAIVVLTLAASRSTEFQELLPFVDKLRGFKRSMEEAGIKSSAPFTTAKWRRGVDQLRTFIKQNTQPQAIVSVAQLDWIVDCVREMLEKACAAPKADLSFATKACDGILKSTAEIFTRPEIDAAYVSQLDKVVTGTESAIRDQQRFQVLSRHVQSLLAVKARLEDQSCPFRPQPTTRPTVVRSEPSPTDSATPTDAATARFDALVNAADELLAVPVSERTGRVPRLVYSLQNELRIAFPTKGKRTTPSRSALDAASDAVRKAVELLQHEPPCGGSHKQLIELLFAISTKYHTLKLLIMRSRDDLYQYVYQAGRPPRVQAPPSKPVAVGQAVGSSGAAVDEAALRGQLLAAHRRVQSWHDDVFSLQEFDDVLRTVRAVMDHKSATWRVTRDCTVADCLRLLALRAHAIKKQEHRDGRLASVEQWQARMDIQ